MTYHITVLAETARGYYIVQRVLIYLYNFGIKNGIHLK